jgi:molybdopterin/thiamine biosynthesis adenylyltransferase
MNAHVRVEARTLKVGEETESDFSDAFFQSHHCIVNALDNIDARVYVDGRCVANQRPLLESGTEGLKGHVQVRFFYIIIFIFYLFIYLFLIWALFFMS